MRRTATRTESSTLTPPDRARPARPGSPYPAAMTAPTLYRERLTVAWWVWPAALAAAALLATELAIGAYGLRTPLTYVIAAALAVAGVAALNRIRVRVAGDELHVDDAHLPVSAIAAVTVLDAAE